MSEFFSREIFSGNFFDLFKAMTLSSVVDIIITAFVIYKILGWIRGTQSEQVLYGILILIVVMQVSDFLGLVTINYVLKNIITVGLLALVIVFQPELRRALGKLGKFGSARRKLINFSFLTNILSPDVSDDDLLESIFVIIDTLKELSATKTGALIVMEREARITDIIDTGVYIDAKISKSLLLNIFYPKTPLHDGAVVIGRDRRRITSAACLLPLTQNKNLNPSIGTRHRAALGMSENSDSLVIVVSEETGVISYCIGGRLSRFVDLKTMETVMKETLLPEDKHNKSKGGKADD